MSKKIIAARVNAAEFLAATRVAQTMRTDSDHAQQAAAIAGRLRAQQPKTVSGLVRVICDLPPFASAADGNEPRTWRIYAKVTAQEQAQVAKFLSRLPRSRSLAEQIAAQLARFAPILHPAQLVRAVVGLAPTRVGAPVGNQNAAKRPLHQPALQRAVNE